MADTGFTPTEQALIDLLWDYLKRDPEHKDRWQTGFGTKTKTGLIASIKRVMDPTTKVEPADGPIGVIRTIRTKNFVVIVDALPDDDLDLSFDDTGEIAKDLDAGRLIAFEARARVFLKRKGESSVELASDYLGSCIYESISDFADHRACGRENRERAAKGETGVCGSYFADMVSNVCKAARKTLIDFQGIRVREKRPRPSLHTYTSGFGLITLKMTEEQARSVARAGQCDDDVMALSKVPAIAEQLAKLDPDDLRRELKEYGAWDAEELADHEQNLQRIVWLAGGDIKDGL